jgi:2-amino-4-hydroxy-6-hydroxymethyldihydropteridine diphosphokinase
MKPCTAYLAIGSNLGDRMAAIRDAVVALDDHPAVAVEAISSIIETDPVGPGMQGRYLNGVLKVRTILDPRELLQQCLAIERTLGRDRAAEQRWGPRTLDIDLLLFGSMVLKDENLTVPHPRMHERTFVLEPLAELAPELVHPGLGQSVQSLRDALRSRSQHDDSGSSGSTGRAGTVAHGESSWNER